MGVPGSGPLAAARLAAAGLGAAALGGAPRVHAVAAARAGPGGGLLALGQQAGDRKPKGHPPVLAPSHPVP